MLDSIQLEVELTWCFYVTSNPARREINMVLLCNLQPS